MSRLIHDLVIRLIAEYFRYDNNSIAKFQLISRRYYRIRDIFIRQIVLSDDHSKRARFKKPYGWNKIHKMGVAYSRLEGPMLELRNLHSLVLFSCHRLRDVTAFKNLNELVIIDCRAITDVSALRNVRYLKLMWCENLRDVSGLTNMYQLQLHSCHGIQDVSGLKGTRNLELRNCDGIRDVSALGAVRRLILTGCDNIVDISALSHVYSLVIRDCEGISDYSHLGHHHKLLLELCTLRDLRNLANVYHLKLDTVDLPTDDLELDISVLTGVHILELKSCYHIKKLPYLRNLKSLSMVDCNNIWDISKVRDIPELKIKLCAYIREVAGIYFTVMECRILVVICACFCVCVFAVL